jgi:hypothetical protein
MAKRTLYYFAVGGTGALSVEPLLHLCAAGLGPERLTIVLIDPDASNPALGRALALIERYERVRKAFASPSEGFFCTELLRTNRKDSVWSPLGAGDQGSMASLTLESYVQRARMDAESKDAAALFNLLFSPVQQREKLEEGFRGNPAIGSIMMHGLRDAPLFRELMNSAKGDTDARFFATGSIFGGTGASALPVLAKLLHDAGIESSRIGGALVTPYYALGIPTATEQRDGRLKPESAKFLSATAAALPTYTGGHTSFGAMYVMGDEQSLAQPRKTYSAGGHTQLNDPHFVELFAALAALDFLDAGREGMQYATLGSTEPTWADLPVAEQQRHELRTYFAAANLFLQYFGADRSGPQEQQLTSELKTMPWLQHIGLKETFVRTHSRELNDLGEFLEASWGWLWAITHNYQPLRLVSFETGSARRVAIPDAYASRDEGHVALPILEQQFVGFKAKQRGGFFRRGDADRLESLASVFSWFNKLAPAGRQGLPGFLLYMRDGMSDFVREWYSAAGAEQRVTT